MRITPTVAATLVAGLLLAGCEDAPASGSGATVVDEVPAAAEDTTDDAVTEAAAAEGEDEATDEPADVTAEGAADEQEADEAALGIRDNPVPVGTVIEVGDWTVTVTEVTADATDTVMGENEFNEPPVDGRQFVMFRTEATYEGDDSGDPWSLSWAIVGSGGNSFSGGASDDWCGVIPNSFDEQGETFPGGTVAGSVCFAVPSDQVDGATILVEDAFSLDDTRAFFELS